ncbi:MAG: FHA domain-containing protein [Acidobacteriia bacterium]|nr:FHA domain-containing protein [Terriglobia bacterium]
MNAQGAQPTSSRFLKVSLGITPAQRTFTFSQPFRIGRADDCEVCVKDEYVSRVHAEVVFENGSWWIRDLQSSNGIFVDGRRVDRAPIARPTVIRLGIEGPELSFEPESVPAPEMLPADKMKSPGSGTILRQYVDHYFSKSANDAAAGEHTKYVRRAFAKVQTQQKRTYGWIIAALLLVAVGAGGYAWYERAQLQRQRAIAEDLFYAMKSLDLDIANVQRAVSESNNQQGAQLVRQYASRRKEMRDNYEQYLTTLHVYNRKMTEEQRILLRVARIFGECEINMPPDFEAEVNKYIKYWQQSDRLATAIRTAQQNGYVDTISKELLDQGLPPQFFYLALQESNFDPYISGPVTRKGIAKGMWQFIPETAVKYGLKVGPLADLRRPDPGDERDQYKKSTHAAARYLKDLYSTDAQASGILVMACYNWGEDQVLPLVRSMPANPRERNFWRLLAHHRDQIPQETYDYVFYIVSAAVIGENPRLFGFDFDNPLANLEAEPARAATAAK